MKHKVSKLPLRSSAYTYPWQYGPLRGFFLWESDFVQNTTQYYFTKTTAPQTSSISNNVAGSGTFTYSSTIPSGVNFVILYTGYSNINTVLPLVTSMKDKALQHFGVNIGLLCLSLGGTNGNWDTGTTGAIYAMYEAVTPQGVSFTYTEGSATLTGTGTGKLTGYNSLFFDIQNVTGSTGENFIKLFIYIKSIIVDCIIIVSVPHSCSTYGQSTWATLYADTTGSYDYISHQLYTEPIGSTNEYCANDAILWTGTSSVQSYLSTNTNYIKYGPKMLLPAINLPNLYNTGGTNAGNPPNLYWYQTSSTTEAPSGNIPIPYTKDTGAVGFYNSILGTNETDVGGYIQWINGSLTTNVTGNLHGINIPADVIRGATHYLRQAMDSAYCAGTTQPSVRTDYGITTPYAYRNPSNGTMSATGYTQSILDIDPATMTKTGYLPTKLIGGSDWPYTIKDNSPYLCLDNAVTNGYYGADMCRHPWRLASYVMGNYITHFSNDTSIPAILTSICKALDYRIYKSLYVESSGPVMNFNINIYNFSFKDTYYGSGFECSMIMPFVMAVQSLQLVNDADLFPTTTIEYVITHQKKNNSNSEGNAPTSGWIVTDYSKLNYKGIDANGNTVNEPLYDVAINYSIYPFYNMGDGGSQQGGLGMVCFLGTFAAMHSQYWLYVTYVNMYSSPRLQIPHTIYGRTFTNTEMDTIKSIHDKISLDKYLIDLKNKGVNVDANNNKTFDMYTVYDQGWGGITMEVHGYFMIIAVIFGDRERFIALMRTWYYLAYIQNGCDDVDFAYFPHDGSYCTKNQPYTGDPTTKTRNDLYGSTVGVYKSFCVGYNPYADIATQTIPNKPTKTGTNIRYSNAPGSASDGDSNVAIALYLAITATELQYRGFATPYAYDEGGNKKTGQGVSWYTMFTFMIYSMFAYSNTPDGYSIAANFLSKNYGNLSNFVITEGNGGTFGTNKYHLDYFEPQLIYICQHWLDKGYCNKYYDAVPNPTISIIKSAPKPVHCLLEGTMIQTDRGYVPIEKLLKGMLVKTLDGFKQVHSVGYSVIENSAHKKRTENRLYKLGKLILTGKHCIVLHKKSIPPPLLKYCFVLSSTHYRMYTYLYPNAIPYSVSGKHTVYHVALDQVKFPLDWRKQYEVDAIYANGILCESTSKEMIQTMKK